MIQFSKLFDLVNKRGLTASFTKSRFGCNSKFFFCFLHQALGYNVSIQCSGILAFFGLLYCIQLAFLLLPKLLSKDAKRGNQTSNEILFWGSALPASMPLLFVCVSSQAFSELTAIHIYFYRLQQTNTSMKKCTQANKKILFSLLKSKLIFIP